jgi:hypothetical protein
LSIILQMGETMVHLASQLIWLLAIAFAIGIYVGWTSSGRSA